MQRLQAVTVLFLTLCLAPGPAISTPSAPAVIEQLIGSWEGEGQLFGRAATFSMSWSWVLEQRFVELRFENRFVQEDGSEQTVLRSTALYHLEDDGTLTGTWFDTRGQVVELRATATADELATHWTAANEEGRTTYKMMPTGAVEVRDQVLSEGDWRPFGNATYRRADAPAPNPGDAMTMRATGSFEIQMKPLETYNQSPDAKVGRMSIDKTLEGDLVATSQGEMLSGGSPAEGSAGYVAIERVIGALHGRTGSFLLQHSGTMKPGSQELTITVVPDSGTGDLAGIAGTMQIEIRDGQHFYVFEYTLPEEQRQSEDEGVR